MLALFVPVLLSALAAAQLPSLPQSTLSVTANGRPVDDAVVMAGGFVARTDATGTVRIPDAALGAEATVAAEGFLPVTLTLVPGPSGVIDVNLEPLAEFAERVVVSASRSPTRLEDQPLRVEVIDEEEIEEKAMMTPGSVAMLIGETTGLRVQPTAPSLGASNVRIQGLRGRYSQMLADGLPLYGGQGDSFSLLQVPPLDLGRVDIIKGAASALYGASALGGVINLVSKRPTAAARQVLLNATSLGGSDAAVWLADVPDEAWRWTLTGTFNRQGRRDRDGDGWTDVAGFERGGVRPRVFFDNGGGTTLLATGGLMLEDREGGTLRGRVAPDGRPFAESLRTSRGDVGAVAGWVTPAARVVHVRGSYGRRVHERQFGESREHGVRETAFGEVSLQGMTRGHVWVVGGAFQRDAFRSRDLPNLGYAFDVPAVFVQDEVSAGAVRLAFSGRLDAHDEYGMLASPRVSLLWRPDPAWTVRVSGGGGAFGPIPFVEATDETGLSTLDPLAGLDAERAWSGSIDLTRRVGNLELNTTWFASEVENPVQMVNAGTGRSVLRQTSSPTQTWGHEALVRYRGGPLQGTFTYAYTRSRELDLEEGVRRDVPLTPRHYAAFDLMAEDERVGRAGLEVYYVGRQSLDDNPFRDTSPGQWIVGALVEKRLGTWRLFLNAENLGGLRLTATHPLVRPGRQREGRWTVDAWGPLDGRVVNGGMRVFF